MLRLLVHGPKERDDKVYPGYSREDVRGKALANAYSQAIGEVFTREMKPLEVEVIVAEVGDDRYADHADNTLYTVTFDGYISDHEGFCVIGGNVEDVESLLRDECREGMPAGGALALGRKALDRGAEAGTSIEVQNLEVCVLERGRVGRKFQKG